jgi:hypothetical protein
MHKVFYITLLLEYVYSVVFNYTDHGANWNTVNPVCTDSGTMQSPVDLTT